MPQFDLRHVQVAERKAEDKTVSYGDVMSAGEAISATLELQFAEGELYAEGRLAEYIREAIGGTLSIGTKYIPVPTQRMMYGATEKKRTIGTKEVAGTAYSAGDTAKYVGVSFYAPDMIDGVKKYTCVFVPKAIFGPPGMALQTKNGNITFQTPTTSGRFLPDELTGELTLETAVVDDMGTAVAWCDAVLGKTGSGEQETGT